MDSLVGFGFVVVATALEVAGRALLAVGDASFRFAGVLGKKADDPEEWGVFEGKEGEFDRIPRYGG
jgi:hypothetical protein